MAHSSNASSKLRPVSAEKEDIIWADNEDDLLDIQTVVTSSSDSTVKHSNITIMTNPSKENKDEKKRSSRPSPPVVSTRTFPSIEAFLRQVGHDINVIMTMTESSLVIIVRGVVDSSALPEDDTELVRQVRNMWREIREVQEQGHASRPPPPPLPNVETADAADSPSDLTDQPSVNAAAGNSTNAGRQSTTNAAADVIMMAAGPLALADAGSSQGETLPTFSVSSSAAINVASQLEAAGCFDRDNTSSVQNYEPLPVADTFESFARGRGVNDQLVVRPHSPVSASQDGIHPPSGEPVEEHQSESSLSSPGPSAKKRKHS